MQLGFIESSAMTSRVEHVSTPVLSLVVTDDVQFLVFATGRKLSSISRRRLSDCAHDVDGALAALRAQSRDVIITRGGEDLLLATRDGRMERFPVLPVKLVSSHGAGDCFCGALAARLAAGDEISSACQFALVAAGLFVSLPEAEQRKLSRQDVEEVRQSQR